MFIEINTANISAVGLRKYENLSIYFQGYVLWEGALFFDSEFDHILFEHFRNHTLEKNCVNYNGIFNLVILHESKIIIIRDRWGIVPLYYTEKKGSYAISDKWEELYKFGGAELNQTALLELVTLGYSLGSKTMLKDVFEYQPHTIIHIRKEERGITIDETSYYNLELPLPRKRSFHFEKTFKDLWQTQIEVYTTYIKKHGNTVHMPFSGGLDCRLLAHELDKKEIDLYALTYGRDRDDEIVSAEKALHHLKNNRVHHILELNHENTERIFSNSGFSERITCSFPSELLHHYSGYPIQPAFMMTGFSGDFMAGSHLKFKMRFWRNKADIVRFIVNFKSTPLLKDLCAGNTEEGEILKNELLKSIPEGPGLLSSFIRWDIEQRQRKYIARSAFVRRGQGTPRVLLPFFDYKLMDFFNGLPFHYLWNSRLYINTQLKHLYHDNPGLINAERVGKRQKIVRNNFAHEFVPKIRMVMNEFLGKHQSMDKNIYSDLDFEALIGKSDLPEYFRKEMFSGIAYPINNLYLYSVSEAYKKIVKF